MFKMIVCNEFYSNISVKEDRIFGETTRTALTIMEQIKNIDLAGIGISEYNQKYILDNYVSLEGWSINALMLSTCLSMVKKPINEMSLLDYGAGSGSICLLAKALGVGTVIYSDIYDLSCEDAEKLARALGLAADQYLVGELGSVSQHLDKNRLLCDILVSNACIEHIYNIEQFFESMLKIPSKKLIFWLSTGANALRAKTCRELSLVARKLENEDREWSWGHKDRDSLQSYFKIRTQIIKNVSNELNEKEIEALSERTRGLRRDDIEAAVKKYLQTKTMPPYPTHPSNTCDPETGNWAERLMNPFELRAKLDDLGFETLVRPAYWTKDTENSIKNIAKAITNFLISILPEIGLRLAPGYVLTGAKHSP
jgi:2-polyprenyl-3-methyl-5-hydroxy-6-metoxy-1,4-benzoquinol methylase